MVVYLVRHGVAVKPGSKGISSDAKRLLTEEGLRKMRVGARGLVALGCRARTVLTSPLIRTRQTADLVCAALEEAVGGDAVEVDETPALKPAAPPEAALRLIAQRAESELVLVGHEPFLSELLSLMLAGHRRMAIDFKKGGAACVTFADEAAPGKGTLDWLVPPKALRGLAR
jgi:phosphohistidine phosphatase